MDFSKMKIKVRTFPFFIFSLVNSFCVIKIVIVIEGLVMEILKK